MPSLKSIKKRISSVKSTRQITKAMKMVSAAKLRRAQENVIAARPYARKLSEVLGRLAQQQDVDVHPLLHKREEAKKGLLIVVTSDRGLCGGFNANICKAADRFARERKGEFAELKIMTIGRKGFEFLRHRQSVWKSYSNIFGDLNYQTAALIAQEVIQAYLAEEFDQVFLLFNAFRSVMSQDITLEQLLPIAPAADAEEIPPQYIYEPSQGALLAELLPKQIEVQLFRSFLESVASEHGARMTAMDSASKNANEMIGKLTLIYNRARQAAITKELMEIISGAESVKG
jgi:F-type H+-transporting ATPase subunit gamma